MGQFHLQLVETSNHERVFPERVDAGLLPGDSEQAHETCVEVWSTWQEEPRLY